MAVANVLDVSRPTASRRIDAAREAGHLGPALGTRAGEGRAREGSPATYVVLSSSYAAPVEQPEWKWQAGAGTLVSGLGLMVAAQGRPLHVSDLSLVGLILDLVGAFYLGRGLIVEPRRNIERGATRLGLSPDTILGVAEDKVDGRLGLAWLVAGFGLQVVAYLLQLGGVESGATGQRAEVAAIGLAFIAGSAAYLTTAVLRPRLLRRELRGIAGLPGLHGDFGIPEASLLNLFAHLITRTRITGLYDPELVERVFGPSVTHPIPTEGEAPAQTSS